MRSRSNGGIIGAYALPTQNYANGVFFIHDAAIYNTGSNPIWPLGTGYITQTSKTGGTTADSIFNTNYKTTTFTSNGTFNIVTGSAYIDVLLVGGGGSSAYSYFNSTSSQTHALGGGGGGTVVLVENLFVDGGTTFTVEVGTGGSLGSYGTSTRASTNGRPSKIISNRGYTVIARGGGGGGVDILIPSTGGSGGGGAYRRESSVRFTYGASTGPTDSYTIGTATINFYQNAGGTANTSTEGNDITRSCAGGGGGAGQPGYDGNSSDITRRGYGGDGFYWNKSERYYGAGGAGGNYSGSSFSGLYSESQRHSEGKDGANGYGVGGSGYENHNSQSSVAPADGGSGTVIFHYRYK